MTDAVALPEPEVAVITAVPSATAITTPSSETVATDAADVVHATVAPAITAPPASLAVAVSRVVSPRDEKSSTVRDNSTLAGA